MQKILHLIVVIHRKENPSTVAFPMANTAEGTLNAPPEIVTRRRNAKCGDGQAGKG